jgi:TRAP-type mannitol/chloroaromatic compound transport system substrate-binding protein
MTIKECFDLGFEKCVNKTYVKLYLPAMEICVFVDLKKFDTLTFKDLVSLIDDACKEEMDENVDNKIGTSTHY